MDVVPQFRQLFTWPAAVGIGVGYVLTAFVFYPPTCGWGGDLKWGDVATWLSATGTIAAVVVALSIAGNEARRARQERHRREDHRTRLLVISLGQYAVPLLNEIRHARRVLPEAVDFAKDQGVDALVEQIRLYSVEKMPIRTELEDIPIDLAEAVAHVCYTAGTYNVIVDQMRGAQFDEFDPAFWKSQLQLDPFLTEIQNTLAKLAKLLIVRNPMLAGINWEDRDIS